MKQNGRIYLNNNLDEQIKSNFIDLINIVKKLRSAEGCDWDKSQTESSLIPYFLEEIYELIDSIDKKDNENLKEELGDVMLHIIFQSQIATEKNTFTINDIIDSINKKLINRHPFPGPGLAVRILGEVRQDYADILRQADNIFIQLLHEKDLYDKISQAFTVFMPVKSVGVTGDGRTYGNVVSLRAVKTIDFMTAKPFEFPFNFLEEVSTRIINEVPEISRVCLDISSKPPATIEWE